MNAANARWRNMQRVLLSLDGVALVRVLWFPVDPDSGATPWWLRWVFFADWPYAHWVLNLFLLVPTAVLVVLLNQSWHWTKTAALCLAVTCMAEAGQFLVPTRVPDWRDVALNASGAAIAAFVLSGRRAA